MQQKRNISLNTGGPTENTGGSFFLRMGFYAKTTLADRTFTTNGIGGASEGTPLVGVSPLTITTTDFTTTNSATWLIGDGKTNYNYVQMGWNTSYTSVSNMEFGYIKDASPGGSTSLTFEYNRLSTLASSGTTLQINDDDFTIDFTPDDGMVYAFVFYNNSGSAVTALNGMATIYANPNLT